MRMHWKIEEICLLYFDNQDYRGLFFWYEKIKEESKRMKG
jgi:hypothetical protein